MNRLVCAAIAAVITLGVAVNGYAAGAPKPQTRNRAEIPAKYQWDFTAIYPNWEAWDAGMREMEAKMDAFAALKNLPLPGPVGVYLYDGVHSGFGRYAGLGLAEHLLADEAISLGIRETDSNEKNGSSGNVFRGGWIIERPGSAAVHFQRGGRFCKSGNSDR